MEGADRQKSKLEEFNVMKLKDEIQSVSTPHLGCKLQSVFCPFLFFGWYWFL